GPTRLQREASAKLQWRAAPPRRGLGATISGGRRAPRRGVSQRRILKQCLTARSCQSAGLQPTDLFDGAACRGTGAPKTLIRYCPRRRPLERGTPAPLPDPVLGPRRARTGGRGRREKYSLATGGAWGGSQPQGAGQYSPAGLGGSPRLRSARRLQP